MGIPKPTLHGLLHKLMLAKSNVTKHTYHPSTKQLSANSNSEKEPTAQSTFSSLPCAGEYPLSKVLDLPNPTQASTNKTSEMEPTTQSIFHSLPCVWRTNGRQPFGSSLTFFLSFLCQDKKGKKKKLSPSEITYESLLALGIPMPTLHRIMHQMLVGNLSMNNHRNFPRHPYRIWHYYKNLQLKNRLSTYTPSNNSLSLLKTNFAKKPKNPV